MSSFPLSVTQLLLFLLFVNATGMAYAKFRQDVDTTEGQALFRAAGAAWASSS
jgi:hypothetical protein